jgi:hypothetical protein
VDIKDDYRDDTQASETEQLLWQRLFEVKDALRAAGLIKATDD